MLILGLLGMYFDAAVVFIISSLFFRLAKAVWTDVVMALRPDETVSHHLEMI